MGTTKQYISGCNAIETVTSKRKVKPESNQAFNSNYQFTGATGNIRSR